MSIVTVVCIKVFPDKNVSDFTRTTIGKQYTSESYEIYPSGPRYYNIQSDDGDNIVVGSKYLVPLDEYRKDKIESILVE